MEWKMSNITSFLDISHFFTALAVSGLRRLPKS